MSTDAPQESASMDVMVLARDEGDSLAAIGPVGTADAVEQIRAQLTGRGWSYLGTAPIIAAAEFRQQSGEAEA
jgi:hypothetical protein